MRRSASTLGWLASGSKERMGIVGGRGERSDRDDPLRVGLQRSGTSSASFLYDRWCGGRRYGGGPLSAFGR